MADAKRCDLCGQFYSESKHVVNCVRLYNSNNAFINKSLPNSEKPFDVCPACGAAFVALYHSRKEIQNDSNT